MLCTLCVLCACCATSTVYDDPKLEEPDAEGFSELETFDYSSDVERDFAQNLPREDLFED